MQLIPATGRQVARQERRRYSTRELYNPEINIRYGTRYLKDVLAASTACGLRARELQRGPSSREALDRDGYVHRP